MGWSVGAGLEGKGVIVTGATGGIGRPVVEAFAATGARVMAVGRDQTKLDALRSEERRVGKEGRSRWAPYH